MIIYKFTLDYLKNYSNSCMIINCCTIIECSNEFGPNSSCEMQPSANHTSKQYPRTWSQTRKASNYHGALWCHVQVCICNLHKQLMIRAIYIHITLFKLCAPMWCTYDLDLNTLFSDQQLKWKKCTLLRFCDSVLSAFIQHIKNWYRVHSALSGEINYTAVPYRCGKLNNILEKPQSRLD